MEFDSVQQEHLLQQFQPQIEGAASPRFRDAGVRIRKKMRICQTLLGQLVGQPFVSQLASPLFASQLAWRPVGQATPSRPFLPDSQPANSHLAGGRACWFEAFRKSRAAASNAVAPIMPLFPKRRW